MKRFVIMMCAVSLMSVSAPVYADHHMAPKDQKNECLLASKGCMQEVDSIKTKIKKLDAEIKKGKKVYSAEEIKKLQQKLDEAEKMLDHMLAP